MKNKVQCHVCESQLEWKYASILSSISYGDYDEIRHNKFICEECKISHCNNCGCKVYDNDTDMYGKLSCKSCAEEKGRRYDAYVTKGW